MWVEQVLPSDTGEWVRWADLVAACPSPPSEEEVELRVIQEIVAHWFTQGGQAEFGALSEYSHNADGVVAAILSVVRGSQGAAWPAQAGATPLKYTAARDLPCAVCRVTILQGAQVYKFGDWKGDEPHQWQHLSHVDAVVQAWRAQSELDKLQVLLRWPSPQPVCSRGCSSPQRDKEQEHPGICVCGGYLT